MPSKLPVVTLCVAISCLGWGPQATAQNFNDLAALLADHPSILALGYEADASRERSVAATALPDPVVSVGINNFPIVDHSFSEFLPTNKALGIRQAIPSRAGREASAAEQRARAKQTDLVREAQLAALEGELISVLHNKTRIALQRDFAVARDAKYDELVDVVEAEIDAGRPAVFRLAEIEAERAEVGRTLVELDRQEAEIDARLIDLVGIVPNTPAPRVPPNEWSGEPMAFHAVRIAHAGIKVAEHVVGGAEAAWRPNWGVQLTYQQREAGQNFSGDDWVTAGVTFTVPLWASRSQKPRLRAANADLTSAELRYQNTIRTVTVRFTAENAARRAAKENIEVLKRNIAAVEDEIESQLNTYESGVGDYAPILDGEISILKLRAEITAEEARRASAIARLNSMVVQS